MSFQGLQFSRRRVPTIFSNIVEYKKWNPRSPLLLYVLLLMDLENEGFRREKLSRARVPEFFVVTAFYVYNTILVKNLFKGDYKHNH